jgi:TP901 family phage tail tape measure protein
MGDYVDQVIFRATAPKGPLPGLDDVHKKLIGIGSALDALNGRLAGLGTMTAFKRTKAELQDLLKTAVGTKSMPVKKVGEVLGVPDIKDFERFVTRWKSLHKDMARTMFESGNKGGGFASTGSAATMAQKYFTQALKNAKEPVAMLRAMFGGGSGSAPPAAGPAVTASGAVVGGQVHVTIPANQIVATIGPGPIPVIVSGTAGASAGGGSSKGGGGTITPSGVSGTLLEEKITTTAKSRQVQQRELLKAGETVDKFFKDVNGALEPLKEVTTRSALKKAQAKLEGQMAAVKAELAEASAKGGLMGARAALLRKQADMMDSFVSGKTGDRLESMGLGALVKQTQATASKMRERANKVEEAGLAEAQGQMVRDFKARARVRKELDAARKKGQAEAEAEKADELKQLDKRIRDNNRMINARAKSDDRSKKEADKVTEFDRKRSQAAAFKSATYTGADYALNDFLASGGRITGTRVTSGNRQIVAEREFGGKKDTLTVNYGKTAAEVTQLQRALKDTRGEAGYLAGDFVKNTAKVTLWAASVGVLYKTLELARHSMTELIEVGAQMKRLDQVFQGVGGTTVELTDDVLELAAANGRSGREAMESAIQWSRLGLTKAEVNTAVRDSLVAANVAELTTADATERLQGVMQSYGLTVGQLSGFLGELNNLSNTYNATNAAMLDGISRTGAVARQAGIPLHELAGFLAATIGATKQSGANIGNMIKSVTLSLSNPAMQKELRQGFGFEVTGGGAEIKGMSQILGELYSLKYQALNDAQRQSDAVFSICGQDPSQPAGGDAGQLREGAGAGGQRAIQPEFSAETENTRIKAALRAQLVGLTTEWERFVVVQGNRGPVQALHEHRGRLAQRDHAREHRRWQLRRRRCMLGIMTAASAKVLLTGMTMRERERARRGFWAGRKRTIAGLAASLITIT